MANWNLIGTAVARVLGILLLLLVIVAGGVFVVWGVIELQFAQDSISEESVTTMSVLFSLFLLLLILVALGWLLRALGRAIWTGWAVFGEHPKIRLIGAGVVALLFPNVVYAVTVSPVRIITDLLSRLPRSLSSIWFSGAPGAMLDVDVGQTVALNDVFTRMGLVVQAVGEELAFAIERFMTGLPWAQLILALAVWVLIGEMLRSPASTASTQYRLQDTRIASYFTGMSSGRRRVLLHVGVFLLSVYLSIAAIVAIPWLEEEVDTDTLGPAELEQVLDDAMIAQDEFDRRFPPLPAGDETAYADIQALLLNTADSLQQRSGDTLPPTFVDRWNLKLTSTQRDIASYRQARQMLREAWQRYRREAFDQQATLRQAALGSYQTETLSPMSNHERGVYYQAIGTWYRNSLNTLFRDINQKRALLTQIENSVDYDLQQGAIQLQSDLSQIRRALAAADADLDSLIPYYYGDSYFYNSLATTALPTFELPNSLDYQPRPPEPGLGWGPFGWVAGWLLRAKSFALALIAGMIGFGLLGAAISSFVRDPVEDKADTGDLVRVLVRGLSAAIVIFLGVEGGLAIFSEGELRPDPYVLFFTCLVGAVFSEDVWGWARFRLRQSLQKWEEKQKEIRVDGDSGDQASDEDASEDGSEEETPLPKQPRDGEPPYQPGGLPDQPPGG